MTDAPFTNAPREDEPPAEPGGPPRRVPFLVRHLTGSRRGSEDRFHGGSVGIGRGRGNRLVLDADLDRTVSARHAEIRVEDGQLVIYDLGSLNGTYLNGRRVRRAALVDGDEIGLGREGPRLRLVCEGGVAGNAEAPMPPLPASRPDEPRRSHEAAPLPPPRSARRKLLLVLAGIAAILLGAVLVVDLRARIGRLEQGGSADGTNETRGVSEADAVFVLLRGAARGAPAAESVDLGIAIRVGRRHAATSDAVFDDVMLFLAGRPGAEITARPVGGALKGRVLTGFRRVPGEAPAAVVVFEAAEDFEGTPPKISHEPPSKNLVLRRPGFAPENAEVEDVLTLEGVRSADRKTGPLLRLKRSGGAAGAALFDAEGSLSGIVAGPLRPGLALSAEAVRDALGLAEFVAAVPLR